MGAVVFKPSRTFIENVVPKSYGREMDSNTPQGKNCNKNIVANLNIIKISFVV